MANDERAALAKQIRTLQRELDQLPYMEADPPWSEHSSPEEDSAITGHGKTTQSVGDGRQGQRQRATHEVREGLGGERLLREDEVYGLAVFGGLHGSDEGKLVQQAAHRLPFSDLTVQVGIIYRDRPLNEATQRQACRATMPTAKIESTTNTRAGATPMTAAQLLSPRRLSPKLSARLGAHIEAQ